MISFISLDFKTYIQTYSKCAYIFFSFDKIGEKCYREKNFLVFFQTIKKEQTFAELSIFFSLYKEVLLLFNQICKY